MDRKAIINHISELRHRHGGLEGMDAKAASSRQLIKARPLPDLYKLASAFASRPGR